MSSVPEALKVAKTVEEAAASADDLQTVVTNVARAFTGVLAVDRVSVRQLSPDLSTLTVVALWTSGTAKIGVGTTMSTLSTSVPEILATGRPAIGGVDTQKLLESVLLDEGIRSWATLPIRDGERLCAVLSLSSKRLAAFDERDEQFFAEIADLVAPHVLRLLAR